MIQLDHVKKSYRIGPNRIPVLDDINLTIRNGDFVAITGPSGAGKSTLMSIIGCLDLPDQGEYFFDGQSILQLDEDQIAAVRREKFGFVFQAFNLIPRLSALQNVELPMAYAGVENAVCHKRARAVLNAVGLGELMDRTPSQLSGGQQQRVAIARSLVNNPPVIVADEPTGNLDSKTASDIIQLFEMLNKAGKTILYVTHDQELVKHANRVIHVADGRIKELR